MSKLALRHEAERHRYLAERDGAQVGVVDYVVEDDAVAITHTGTDPAHQGQGIASALTRFALDDLRERGVVVRPRCPYTRDWISRHPEYRVRSADG